MNPTIRVLVTGSRGKSSVVRLLHAAFVALGLSPRSRITGALPRELTSEGTLLIERSGAPHVEEMRWWLRQVPQSAEAVVLENSAIAPELQGLAARWLHPGVTVLTNAYEDHQEAWGTTRADAAEALALGVPRGGLVVLPTSLATDAMLLAPLARRDCRLEFAAPVPGIPQSHRAINVGLALKTAQLLGLNAARSLKAMLELEPDPFDFRVLRRGPVELAMAFAANDVTSTRNLFESLRWSPEDTRLLYNHRSDRPARWRSFRGWLSPLPWREVIIMGDRPLRKPAGARHERRRDLNALLGSFASGDRVFGCGNLVGLPLTLTAGEQ
jgi:hypothetical protein